MSTTTDQLAAAVDQRVASIAREAASLGATDDVIAAIGRAHDHLREGEVNGAHHHLTIARRRASLAEGDTTTLVVKLARVEGYISALNVAITADADAFTIAGV